MRKFGLARVAAALLVAVAALALVPALRAARQSDFFRDLDENHGRVTPERHTSPIIRARIDEWLEAKGHNHSEQDRIDADANLIAFLKTACQTDVAAAQRQISYDYFLRDLADQQQTRGEMVKAFQEILRNEGQ